MYDRNGDLFKVATDWIARHNLFFQINSLRWHDLYSNEDRKSDYAIMKKLM